MYGFGLQLPGFWEMQGPKTQTRLPPAGCLQTQGLTNFGGMVSELKRGQITGCVADTTVPIRQLTVLTYMLGHTFNPDKPQLEVQFNKTNKTMIPLLRLVRL